MKAHRKTSLEIHFVYLGSSRSQWLHCLRRGSVAALLLGLWFPVHPGASLRQANPSSRRVLPIVVCPAVCDLETYLDVAAQWRVPQSVIYFLILSFFVQIIFLIKHTQKFKYPLQ